MFKRAITHRDEFIVAQALIYALDGLQRLPEDLRPESNLHDMKAILAELPITVREKAERDTGRWLLLGAWDVRSRSPSVQCAGIGPASR
jgi:hypothetical protein